MICGGAHGRNHHLWANSYEGDNTEAYQGMDMGIVGLVGPENCTYIEESGLAMDAAS